jgi:hypothetical protein
MRKTFPPLFYFSQGAILRSHYQEIKLVWPKDKQFHDLNTVEPLY